MYLGNSPLSPLPTYGCGLSQLPLPPFFRREFDRWVCGSRHLSHICFEVLKNALRAVVEKHGPGAESFPPIRMLVAEGEEVTSPPLSPLEKINVVGHHDQDCG